MGEKLCDHTSVGILVFNKVQAGTIWQASPGLEPMLLYKDARRCFS